MSVFRTMCFHHSLLLLLLWQRGVRNLLSIQNTFFFMTISFNAWKGRILKFFSKWGLFKSFNLIYYLETSWSRGDNGMKCDLTVQVWSDRQSYLRSLLVPGNQCVHHIIYLFIFLFIMMESMSNVTALFQRTRKTSSTDTKEWLNKFTDGWASAFINTVNKLKPTHHLPSVLIDYLENY